MFPTPVGMNRQDTTINRFIFNVPHTRGDEPASVYGVVLVT